MALTIRIFAFKLVVASILFAEGFLPSVRQRRTFLCSPLSANNKKDDEEHDLFEYFDPLLSPHAYPNGISPDQKPLNLSKESDDPRYDPRDELREQIKQVHATSLQVPRSSASEDRPPIDTSKVFDPTISPHEYTGGEVPDTIIGDEDTVYLEDNGSKSKKIGILLMDHGSRNDVSNRRLHDLARLYQDSIGTTNVIVKAAHMEIASPSIPEGLQSLIEYGVDEIVCHPYFLSPGRHVQQDIPEIVQGAIDKLNIDIPVTTTAPVGSNTDLMIGAIHSIVEESSVYFQQVRRS